jgi:hypothetical protein
VKGKNNSLIGKRKIEDKCEVCEVTFSNKYILSRHFLGQTHIDNLAKFNEMTENKKAKMDKNIGLLTRLEAYQV